MRIAEPSVFCPNHMNDNLSHFRHRARLLNLAEHRQSEGIFPLDPPSIELPKQAPRLDEERDAESVETPI